MRPDDSLMHEIPSVSKKKNKPQVAYSSVLQHFKSQLNIELLESVHDAMIICDDQQHILLWNRKAEQIYKWTQQEAQGQIYHELLKSQLLSDNQERLLAPSLQDSWEGELLQVCRDGTNITVKSKQTISRSANQQHSIIFIANQISLDSKLIDQKKTIQLHLMDIAREIGLWSWDLKSDQVFISLDSTNNKHNEIYTYAQFLQTINPKDRARMNRVVQNALKTGLGYSIEYRRWMRTDQKEHRVKVVGRVIHDEQGIPVYVIGVATDVTDQRNLETRLKEANHHLQVVLETIDDYFIFLDPHWNITYISRKTEEFTHRSPDSLRGKNIWKELSHLRGSLIEQKIHEAVDTQKALQFENLSANNGRWYNIRLYPAIQGLAIYCHDITEYKTAKSALQASETKLSWLLDTNTISLIVIDGDGNIHEANDAFLNLLGFTRQDLNQGKINWQQLTTPEYRETNPYYIDKWANTHTFEPFENEFFDKYGKRIPVMIAEALIEPDNPLITVLIIDMSTKKQLEKQNEMFLGIVGHELRTPLTAINGSIQLAQRRLQRFMQEKQEPLEPSVYVMFYKLNKLLEQSLRQTRVQNRLINDLLDVSRLAIDRLELNIQPQDLLQIVKETVEDLRYTAGEREIRLKLPSQSTISIQADGNRIGQVISNYVTNALKYSEYSEDIVVEVTLTLDEARVWVRDKGPGLSEADQKHIWESYYRGSNAKGRQGSGINLGLGLHICQTLIQRHHGQVGVQSNEREGSSFWFSLPITHT